MTVINADTFIYTWDFSEKYRLFWSLLNHKFKKGGKKKSILILNEGPYSCFLCAAALKRVIFVYSSPCSLQTGSVLTLSDP